MEGDAGASRLNPADTDDSSSSEVKSEDSSESEVGTDQIGTEDEAEQTSTEQRRGLVETEAEQIDTETKPTRLAPRRTPRMNPRLKSTTVPRRMPRRYPKAEAAAVVADEPVASGPRVVDRYHGSTSRARRRRRCRWLFRAAR